jgi:hypothetical protein
METPYQSPNILRLLGVQLVNYVPVEDKADERLLTGGGSEAAAPEDPPSEGDLPRDKIPRSFSSLEDWPHGTNLRCWQCDFTFSDRPKFVPTSVREGPDGGIEFGVQGNMCTFNCAELWILVNLKGEERWRAQDDLRLVYFLFTGVRTAHIRPAVPKTELRQYGGELDEETFWKKMRELDPVAGLRDHTPGSIVPERNRVLPVPEPDRVRAALVTLHVKTGVSGAPAPRAVGPACEAGSGPARPPPKAGGPLAVDPKSVWSVCGLPGLPAGEACGAGEAADSVPLGDDHGGARADAGPWLDRAGLGDELAALLEAREGLDAAPSPDPVDVLTASIGGRDPSVDALSALLGETPAPAEDGAPTLGQDSDLDILGDLLGEAPPVTSAPSGGPAPLAADDVLDSLLAELGV